MQREKAHLLDMNKHYLGTMSQLEVKLADFRSLLKLKDKELELLKTVHISSEPITEAASAQALQDLESKILLLEEENRRLKQTSALSGDIERLRMELAQALELKASYEEQFKEATIRMLTIEQEDTNMSPDEESQSGDLETAAQLQRTNQTLHEEVETFTQQLGKVKQERDFLRTEVIPVLEQTIKLYEVEKNELEKRLEDLRQKSAPKSETPEDRQVPRPHTTMKTQADHERLVHIQVVRPKSSLSPKQTTVISQYAKPMSGRPSAVKKPVGGGNYVYSPSFLRGKKPAGDKKNPFVTAVKAKGKKPEVREDHFADDFPEENELI